MPNINCEPPIKEFNNHDILIAASDFFYSISTEMESNGQVHIGTTPAGLAGTLSRMHLFPGSYSGVLYVASKITNPEPAMSFEIISSGKLIFKGKFNESTAITFDVDGTSPDLEFRLISLGQPFTFRGLGLTRTDWADMPTAPYDNHVMSNRRISAIWKSIHEKGKGDGKSLPSNKIDFGFDPRGWSLETTIFISIDISNTERLINESSFLLGHGLCVSALELNCQDLLTQRATIARLHGDTDAVELFEHHQELISDNFDDGFLRLLSAGDGSDQFTVVGLGFVSCLCPYSGIYVKSRHGYPISYGNELCNFYRFEGEEIFYLAVCGFSNRRMFIYIPIKELVINIAENVGCWVNSDFLVWELKAKILGNLDKISNYLVQNTDVAIVTGASANLGHYIWNDLAGIIRFRDSDLIHERFKILAYRHEALSTVGVLKWPQSNLTRYESSESLFQAVLDRNLLPVRLASLRVTPNAAASILRYCTSLLSQASQAELEAARQFDTLIFFNLRAHNKAWVDQVNGAVAIAERASETSRSIALYLDGMPDCAEMAEEIARRVPKGVGIFQGFNVPLPTTIAWAAACDAYVATIGSGLTLLTWLAGKPGVAHSEHHHLTQMNFWPEVRPDVPKPTPVDAADVVEITAGSYGNYSIKPEVVVDLLWPLLERKPA